LGEAKKVGTLVFGESFLHSKKRFAGFPATWRDPRAPVTSPGSEGAVFQPQQCSRHDWKFSHVSAVSYIIFFGYKATEFFITEDPKETGESRSAFPATISSLDIVATCSTFKRVP
jgi:hypothetical protein